MNRLTWRDIYDGAYAQDIIQQDYDTATVYTGEAIDRLAEYEDIGLTPEQTEKMIKEKLREAQA